jgi:hypothetical protein
MRKLVWGLAFIAVTTGLLAQNPIAYRESSTGLGTPTFEAGPTEFDFADVNGDGHPDLVTIGDHGNPGIGATERGLIVWFGNGEGSWTSYQTGNFGYGGIALGDLNWDGLMDAAYAMHHNYSGVDFGNQLIEAALGDGTGKNWTPWDDGLATNGEDWGMFGTDLADVNNDGLLDIGSVSFGCCAGVHIYRNNGNGTWTQTFGYTGGNSQLYLAFGDINGDGNADFACGLGNTPGSVYFGDGKGSFSVADGNLPPAGNLGRGSVALADVTNDGRPELAYVNSSGGLQVWKWKTGTTWENLTGTLPVSGCYAVQLADMNLDGFGDVIAMKDGRVDVYTGNGFGDWQLSASITTPDNCDWAAFRAGTDVDHNGYPDLCQMAEENCSIWSGGTNRPRVYVESSTPSQLFIHPVSPRGGEVFRAGSVQFLDYTAAIPAGHSSPQVKIELSLSGPTGPWRTLDSIQKPSGRYQWLIPAAYKTSHNCYLRYTVQTSQGEAEAITPRAFTILGRSLDIITEPKLIKP